MNRIMQHAFATLPLNILCLLCALSVLSGGDQVFAQAPGVEIVRDRSHQLQTLIKKANELREAGELLSQETITLES